MMAAADRLSLGPFNASDVRALRGRRRQTWVSRSDGLPLAPTPAEAGQLGPAIRAEELLGKSVGMWIDRSLQLSGKLNDSHITALLELARKRRAEPVDLADEETET